MQGTLNCRVYATCAIYRLSCILSFRVHVKLSYRIVSYGVNGALPASACTIPVFCYIHDCGQSADHDILYVKQDRREKNMQTRDSSESFHLRVCTLPLAVA